MLVICIHEVQNTHFFVVREIQFQLVWSKLNLSLFFSIIPTFLLYKISIHSQQCWCVVHSGCGPITASLHEHGVGQLYKYIGPTCGPLILQVIQSHQPGPIDGFQYLQSVLKNGQNTCMAHTEQTMPKFEILAVQIKYGNY